jgi:hypothetical protein
MKGWIPAAGIVALMLVATVNGPPGNAGREDHPDRKRRAFFRDTLHFDTARKLLLRQEADLALSASVLQYTNWKPDAGKGQVSLQESVMYRFRAETNGTIRLLIWINHSLGIINWFDSISRFQPDETTLNLTLDAAFRKRWSANFSGVATTRLTDDRSSGLVGSCFLTPVIVTFSGGLGLNFKGYGSCQLGMTSAKFTWIRKSSVFGILQTDTYYGVPKGKTSRLEYGISLRILVDREVAAWLRWNADLLLFKDYRAPVDITWKNRFEFRVYRVIKVILQTRMLYEPDLTKSLQFENFLSAGIALHL